MLRAFLRTSKVKLGHPIRRVSSRYVYIVAASAAVLLSKSFSEEVTIESRVEEPKLRAVKKKVDHTKNVLSEKLAKAWEWLVNVLQALIRCGMLWIRFLPAITTSPALILQSEAVSAWWWGVLRASICNAGPTFIKFSQVT